MVPVCLVLVARIGRPAMMSPVAGVGGAAFLALLAWWLFRRNVRRFKREEILTKWR